jgi:alpha-beta hydrolase superfamily lysophospholipase
MITTEEWTFPGTRTEIAAKAWRDPGIEPTYVALLVHGYGEHIGRYEHVAAALVAHGASVYGLDHLGHGKSGGDRVTIEDFDDVVADLHTLDLRARDDCPGRRVVLIGHSMGGMIAARYAQLHGDSLAAVVLSGPVIGEFALLDHLLAADENLDAPLDIEVLSRDASVCNAYAADPLVWHGAFQRTTVEAMAATVATINEGGSLGPLPLLWVHGQDDALVPINGSRVGIERLRGATFDAHEYPGARHEVFNEINSDEVLADVKRFLDKVLT